VKTARIYGLNFCRGKALADGRHDFCKRLTLDRAGVLITGAQVSPQETIADKTEQRQTTMVAPVAMKKTNLPTTGQGILGGIKIENQKVPVQFSQL
jgi:hypothetical protein